MSERAFFIDYSRCIGCEACVQACEECETHRGRSLIHLETVARRDSVQTAPQVCVHCVDPICAEVCPADAIKQTPDGVVQSSLKARCIGCSNCVLACPFGVPKYYGEIDQMMKCDMCYDRTSTGRGPMCATLARLKRPVYFQTGPEDFPTWSLIDALYQVCDRRASRVADSDKAGSFARLFRRDPKILTRFRLWLSETWLPAAAPRATRPSPRRRG